MSNEMKRIADALERLAAAHEALVLMAQVFATEDEQQAPVPQTILTQAGPVALSYHHPQPAPELNPNLTAARQKET